MSLKEKSKNPSRCLLCICKLFFYMTSVMGMSSFYFKCEHNDEVNYRDMKLSKGKIFISFLVTMAFLFLISYNLYVFVINQDRPKDSIEIFKILIYTMEGCIIGTKFKHHVNVYILNLKF